VVGDWRSTSHDLDVLVRAGLVPDLTVADVERIRGLLIEDSGPDRDRDYLAKVGAEELLEWASWNLDTLLRAGVILDGSDSR
jgi:hypothetical protein